MRESKDKIETGPRVKNNKSGVQSRQSRQYINADTQMHRKTDEAPVTDSGSQ